MQEVFKSAEAIHILKRSLMNVELEPFPAMTQVFAFPLENISQKCKAKSNINKLPENTSFFIK